MAGAQRIHVRRTKAQMAGEPQLLAAGAAISLCGRYIVNAGDADRAYRMRFMRVRLTSAATCRTCQKGRLRVVRSQAREKASSLRSSRRNTADAGRGTPGPQRRKRARTRPEREAA